MKWMNKIVSLLLYKENDVTGITTTNAFDSIQPHLIPVLCKEDFSLTHVIQEKGVRSRREEEEKLFLPCGEFARAGRAVREYPFKREKGNLKA